MPMQTHRYPENWKQIASEVKKRQIGVVKNAIAHAAALVSVGYLSLAIYWSGDGVGKRLVSRNALRSPSPTLTTPRRTAIAPT